MTKKTSEVRQRFDRLLAAYQKISLFLLLPPLLSAFSAVFGMFNADYKLTFCMGILFGLKPVLGNDASLWTMIISFMIVALYVPLALFASKGKFWCYLVAAGLYFADAVYFVTLFNQLQGVTYWLNLVLHLLFIAAEAVGVVYYVRADKLLKAHTEEILGK